jgi:hypothetical protein
MSAVLPVADLVLQTDDDKEGRKPLGQGLRRVQSLVNFADGH